MDLQRFQVRAYSVQIMLIPSKSIAFVTIPKAVSPWKHNQVMSGAETLLVARIDCQEVRRNGNISCAKTQIGTINLCVSPKTETSFKPYKNVNLTLVLLYTSLASLSFGQRSIICPMADWKHKLSKAAKLCFQ